MSDTGSTSKWRPFAVFAAGALVAGGASAPPVSLEERPLVKRGSRGDYSMLQRIGEGKYGEVFEGVCQRTGGKCAIKSLKGVAEDKFQREVQVLEAVRGGPNIIELLDVTKDSGSRSRCLVFEYVEKTPSKEMSAALSDRDVRVYMYQLIEAVAHCHAQGIMHRDLKPGNVVIDHTERKLRLIDFGLAEFCRPGVKYSVHVSSRYYKAPELLCGLGHYDYGLDTWGLGCMFAGRIFRKEHFFQGRDDADQLVKIASVLGTAKLVAYMCKYKLSLDDEQHSGLRKMPTKAWDQFVTEKNRDFVSEEALDLLDRMLVYDHAARITPKDALDHPYFDPIRQSVKRA